MLITSDLVTLLVEGLRCAGPDPERAALVAGLEQLRSVPMASGADVTFGRGEHWGFRAAARFAGTPIAARGRAVTDFDWPLACEGGRGA